MADTQALRKEVERQIGELQDKLRQIKAVEDLERDLGLNRPTQAVIAAHEPPSVPDVCRAALDVDWRGLDYYETAVHRVLPDVKRQAISVALRRLAERKIAESKSKGSRREGNEYRRKPT